MDHLKDVPRFVTYIERGLYKADKLTTFTTDIEHSRSAFEAAVNRSTVSAHVVFA